MFISKYTGRKSLEAIAAGAQDNSLAKTLGPVSLVGLGIGCIIGAGIFVLVMTGMVPYQQLGVPDPVAVAMDATRIGWLSVLVKFAALAGLTTVIFVLLFGQARILFSISQDHLLPGFFSEVHPRFRTPFTSQLLIGIVVALVAACFPIGVLGEMVSIGTLFAFLLVCAAVIYLRHRAPDAKRPFRAPGLPWVALLGIGFSLLLMLGLPLLTWLRLLVWLAIGLAIYFSYGHRHSAVPEVPAE
ncbi:MAG TPA: amino acid permease [Acetobacteraceae bacterium]|nr:amino acid permease [Acetobacteraceae bacterium]